jgi:hypothetical protein
MPFAGLIHKTTEILKNSKFEPLDEGGGERHGAWEWVWVRRRDGVGNYYVSLSAVESAGATYHMEVWAGADDNTHFGRCLVREFPSIRDDKSGEPLWDEVLQSLGEAASRASGLAITDLTGTYVKEITPG